MQELISSALTMFFVTIGPLEVATIFLAVTPGFSSEARKKIAVIACLIGGMTLFVFALGGNALLHALGVGLPAFRTAGGILLLKMAADLIFLHHSQLSSLTKAEEDEAIHHASIAVFPLSIPMIAGPGSMTAVVLLMGRATTPLAQGVVLGSLGAIMIATFAALAGANRLVKFMGLTGANVVARISGILLAALAMQFVFDGLRESGILGR
jgi:multiple antibiotic resistance protein